MSTTFLTGVNDVLTRAGIISGSSGALTSFTDSGRQNYIDLAIQIWNETIDMVYDMQGIPRPGGIGSTTITLVAGTVEYSLPSDLVKIRWPMMDTTNGNYIEEYPGGWEQMRLDQAQPSQYTGMPLAAVINPVTGLLRFDRTPTSEEAGNAYNLVYDSDEKLDSITDTFPFSDATYRALVPVVTEGWEAMKRNDFNGFEYRKNLSRAMTFANKTQRRTHW